MGLKRLLAPLVVLVVASTLVLGLVSGLVGSFARDSLEALGLRESQGATTLSPGALDPSGTSGPTPTAGTAGPTAPSSVAGLPGPVLAAVGRTAAPSPAKVAARVRGVKVKDSGGYSGLVLDLGSGKVLFAHNAGRAVIPASTMKLLTAATALSVLGPEHRFATTVVSPRAGQVVLVGGGDPYLQATASRDAPSRASLATLARATAQALRRTGVRKVSLGYDASRFSGPAWNPTWPDSYADVATPVSALWVNQGRVVAGGGVVGPRVKDPAKVAAATFAAALEKQGIDVGAVSRTRVPGSAAKLASVSSMTLERIVEHVLMTSDNDGAEVLLRQAAIGAGRKGTFADGTATVRSVLSRLGAWDKAASVHDGSGLSRRSRVPAEVMVEVLRLAGEQRHPELRAVVTGLPVAGVEGSLAREFGSAETLAGRGLVRGKTGTLSKVHALAGLIRTRDGSLLAYAFLVNNPKNGYNATVWLQRVTTALSTCGCR